MEEPMAAVGTPQLLLAPPLVPGEGGEIVEEPAAAAGTPVGATEPGITAHPPSSPPAELPCSPAAQPQEQLQLLLQNPAVDTAGNRAPVPAAPQSSGGLGLGAGGGVQSNEFEEVQDYSQEPLESRFASKDLNRRCSAYAEVTAAMTKSSDADPAGGDCFALLRRNLGTCLGETLPKGQDAALSALAAYLENCPGLDGEELAAEVFGLIQKLIDHKTIDKPKLQQLAPGIVVLVAEICECPGTVKEIMECLTAIEGAKKKTQGFLKKQIAFAIKLIYHLIAEFGLPKMSPKLGYLSVVLKFINDSDRGIREACYSVLVELSAWMGDIPDACKSMDDPQKKELTKRVEALTEEEKTRTEAKRFYRGEKKPDASCGAAKDGSSKPFDRYEAVDALHKLPKVWCIEKVFAMEKWKEKQQHLQVLSAAVDVKRLAPSEGYSALVPALQRLLKTESTIPVLTEAAKCVGLIAKGLRSEFDRPTRQLLPAALSRIIDKSVWKPNILIDKIEQMLWAVPFEVFLEELRPYLASKSTWAKKESMGLILRTLDLPQVQESCPDAAQRFFPTLATCLIPAADDSDHGVRHEACKCLAVLVHRNLSSPNIGPLVLERFPSHRQSSFEEEWRKLGVEERCPLDGGTSGDRGRAASNTSSVASMASRRTAGGNDTGTRSRPTSPMHSRPGSPRQGTSPGRSRGKTTESPSRMRQPAAFFKGGREVGSPRNSAPARARSTDMGQLDEQSILESSIVKEMAEEIKSLRSAVARLEKAQEPAAAASAGQAAVAGQARGPSEGRAGARQPRISADTGGREHGTTPSTVRCQTTLPPMRAQSAGRADEGEAPVPERRLSGHSGCASPRPVVQRPAFGRVKTPRPSSSEARLDRDSSTASLRGEASATTAPLGPNFKIEPPKQPKHLRQQRERCQHWGPDPIAAEHLTALKESWKQCVPERVHRCMFSDRMDDQLLSLQTWRQKVSDQIDGIVEVLDMLLKWLTWMLFNTNTQVWKLVLDVSSILLDRLAAAEIQLTEREAQILATTVLERSGHNIASMRESMMAILRQILVVYPRLKLLPLIVTTLASKNKRSVACAMRLLGDALDRQVVSTLARTQKDLGIVLKLVDDKDPDIRRAAVHATASLSQHLDADTFSRILTSMPKNLQPIVRTAASRLPPAAPAEASIDSPMQRSPSTAALATQPQSKAAASGAQSPGKAHLQGGRASPRPSQSEAERAEPSPAGSMQHAPSPHTSSPSGLTGTEAVPSLAQRLVQCGSEDFRTICGALKQRVRHVNETDAIPLAEALEHAMRMYFGHDGCSDRCMPLVELLDEFCSSKECLRPLPRMLLRGMLKEQLRNLQFSSWTKRVENGPTILRTLNLSCVMLLNGINRTTAYSLLLELGTEESEAVHSSLVIKCLRKLNKSLSTCRNVEAEVHSVLDVVRQWLQKVHPRLAQPPDQGREKGMVELAAAALMDGVKEVAEAARTACPAAATAFANRTECCGKDAQQLQEWILHAGINPAEKENQPAPGVVGATCAEAGSNTGPQAGSPCKGEASPGHRKRRMSSPAKLWGSPCHLRNNLS